MRFVIKHDKNMRAKVILNSPFYLLYSLFSLLCLSACDLLSPGEVQNPNVEEQDFAASTDAMRTWVNGANARFAVGIARFAEYTAILSDEVYNNSSRSSKTYDVLDIRYTDGEVSTLSTCLGEMIEMADFGLETLANRDAATTSAECFNLCYIKAIAYLMGGENFVALPREARGKVLEGKALVEAAMQVLSQAQSYAQSTDERALCALLSARAYRLLGNAEQATTQAYASLRLSPMLLLQAHFDDVNGYANSIQEYIAGQLFTILPRLQAQAVKCPQAGLWEQPIAVAKSEEAHLILAEAAVAQNRLAEAAAHLTALLDLVQGRHDAAVSVVSVTQSDIEQASTSTDSMMELVYLLRQEVFFAEGRRASDMGLRLPLSEVEYHEQGSLPAAYTQPVIPAYLQEIRTSLDSHDDLNERMVKARVSPFIES